MRRLLSPGGFLAAAALLALAYGLAHALGLRADATVISGTDPGGPGAALLGWLYVALHFAFVAGVPVLVLGAGIFAAGLRLLGRRARLTSDKGCDSRAS